MTNIYNWSHRKLTDEQVAEVRREHANGISYAKLAKKYNVGATTIRFAVQRRTYNKPNPLAQRT